MIDATDHAGATDKVAEGDGDEIAENVGVEAESASEALCYEDTGFQTLENPVSSKCFTFAVANSVTPKAWRQRAMRRS